MERQVRHGLAGERGKTGVLHKDGIRTGSVQVHQVPGGISQFPVMDEGIDRDINPDTAGMGKPDRLLNLSRREIPGILPCAELFPAEVDRIGTGSDSSPECLR
jgi:hypothetical protein